MRKWTSAPLITTAIVSLVLGLLSGCGGAPAEDPVELLSEHDAEFLATHWVRPVPLQGEPPEGWPPVTIDLAPESCGTCHPSQLSDWKTTLHAHAYSPGLEGQMIPWFEDAPASVEQCMVCHGPLSEQLRKVRGSEGGYVDNPAFDRDLEQGGIVCAACHVRQWQRFGPPRRDGSVTPAPEGTPHDGAIRMAAFESSEFCAACHQFEQPAPNGKSLENTVREWEESRYPAAGITCQTCHMPDRRHLWRGIHDPEMTRSGVTPHWLVQGEPDSDEFEVSIVLENTGTGHHFPTYVTPAVDLHIAFFDAADDTLDHRRRVLQRDVFFDGTQWVEREDDRIPAGESRALRLEGPAPDGATRVAGWVVVRPDAFYADMFTGLVPRIAEESPARPILEEARDVATGSPYRLFEWETILVERQ